MASKGPAPLPGRLRALHRLPDRAPGLVPAQVPVDAPASLSPAARGVWDRLAGDLTAKGVLDAWGVDSFARLCWLTAQSEHLRATIDAEGSVVAGARNGEPVKHKVWPILRQVDAELLQLEGRFGLTPADRSRVSPVASDGPSGVADPARLLS